MKNISYMVLTAALALGGFSVAPAVAASSVGQVPMCDSTTSKSDMAMNLDKERLDHRSGETLQSLDVWNGCLKAIYTDANGHSTTAFYDPDTLNLVAGTQPHRAG
ncbi:MAG TPA: hypothetical protein VHZ56_09180 [Devosia sp.]|jgi:hypothetical protein|nr:hypothetical protein [Devosia sp.]